MTTPASTSDLGSSPRQMRRWQVGFTTCWLVLTVFLAVATNVVVERWALSDIRDRAQATLDFNIANLQAALEKFRVLTPVIARQQDVISTFQAHPALRGAMAERLNFQLFAGMTGVEEIQLINPSGQVFYRSSGRQGDLDVTESGYFEEAMGGLLGRESHVGANARRFYTFAHPVRHLGRTLGVVSVRVPLDRIEEPWALIRDPIFAVDRNRHIIMANESSWRLLVLTQPHEIYRKDPLPSLKLMYRILRPGDDGQPDIVTINQLGQKRDRTTGYDIATYIPILGWDMHVIAPTAPARRQGLAAGLITGLLGMLLSAGFYLLMERRRRLIERARLERATALRLERRVRDRTRELHKAQEDLVQAAKMAALGRMSTALSHEYNQPLAAIRTNADNAQLLIDRDRLDEARSNLDRINKMVERMARLSKTLKSFARKPGQNLSTVDLAATFDEVVMLVTAEARRCKATLSCDPGSPPVRVHAGPVRLSQVLVNLVTNALQAVEGQEIREVTLAVQRINGNAHITVSDTGPGVDQQTRDSLFEPFFTTKRQGEGLGLGLSIAYTIVSDFGGTMQVENNARGGAIFLVTLPLAEDDANREEAAE